MIRLVAVLETGQANVVVKAKPWEGLIFPAAWIDRLWNRDQVWQVVAGETSGRSRATELQ
jgi:hypothetical protein